MQVKRKGETLPSIGGSATIKGGASVQNTDAWGSANHTTTQDQLTTSQPREKALSDEMKTSSFNSLTKTKQGEIKAAYDAQHALTQSLSHAESSTHSSGQLEDDRNQLTTYSQKVGSDELARASTSSDYQKFKTNEGRKLINQVKGIAPEAVDAAYARVDRGHGGDFYQSVHGDKRAVEAQRDQEMMSVLMNNYNVPDLARNYATKYTAEEMNTLNRVENSSAFMGGLSQVHADTGPRPNMNSITPGKILKGDPSASGFLPVRPTTTAPQSQPLGDKPLGPTTTVNSTIPGPKMPGAPANLPGSNALEASVDKKLPKKP